MGLYNKVVHNAMSVDRYNALDDRLFVHSEHKDKERGVGICLFWRVCVRCLGIAVEGFALSEQCCLSGRVGD